MSVRRFNTCSDQSNSECSNYIDKDADEAPRHELAKDYRGHHRSKFPVKKVTTIPDFIGKFDAKTAFQVVAKNNPKSFMNVKPAPTQANTDVVPPLVKAKAHLSEASYLKDAAKAQEYLDKAGLDYEVIAEHTNDYMLTAIDSEGKVTVAFRGTEITNIADVYNDIRIIQGAKRHFAKERAGLENVFKDFAKENVDLTGHSLGAHKAIELGRQLGLDTETFQPLIGKGSLGRGHPNTRDIVWGTTDDIASQLAELGDFEVNRIKPLKSSLNLKDGHATKNFFETGERRADFREATLNDAHNAGKTYAELELVRDIKETQKSFKEFMREHSPNDVLPEGSFSNRVTNTSRFVQIWEELGKPFTFQENLDIASRPSSSKRSQTFTTKEERTNLTPETLEKARVKMFDLMEKANTENEVHSSVGDALIDSIHPVSLAKGTVASLGGAALAEFVDPEHKLNEDAHQALAGGTGGILTEMAIATTAITAGSLLVGSAAGVGGAVAGYETQKAVENAMRNAGFSEDDSGSLSSMTGGAVAGGASSLVAIGGSIAFGAEVGSLGGPLGVALGIGVGTVAGLGGWAIGKIFHHEDNTPTAFEIHQKQREIDDKRLIAARDKKYDETVKRRNEYYAANPAKIEEAKREDAALEDAQVEVQRQPTQRNSGSFMGTQDNRQAPVERTSAEDVQRGPNRRNITETV